MLSSPNAVNGLSVADLLTLFSTSSSGYSSAPNVGVTYSISPAGITRVVVNHNPDQSQARDDAAFNASPSWNERDAAAQSNDVPSLNYQEIGRLAFEGGGGSGGDAQPRSAGGLATASDGALMNIDGAELYLSWNESEATD